MIKKKKKKITLLWAHDDDGEYFSVLNQNFHIATVMFPDNSATLWTLDQSIRYYTVNVNKFAVTFALALLLNSPIFLGRSKTRSLGPGVRQRAKADMKQSDRHVRRSIVFRRRGEWGGESPPFFVYLESFCNRLWNSIIQLIVLKNPRMMKQNLGECALSPHFLRPRLSGSAQGVCCYNTENHCLS